MANRSQRRALGAVLAINAVMFAVLVTAALWGRTVALFADSFDNLGDAVTYAISIWAVGRGAKAKAQVSMLKGILILAAAGLVIARVAQGLIDPQTPVFAVMGGFSILALLANGACLAILWRHRAADLNMESVWHCSRNDIATNVSVIVAAGLVWMLGSRWPDILLVVPSRSSSSTRGWSSCASRAPPCAKARWRLEPLWRHLRVAWCTRRSPRVVVRRMATAVDTAEQQPTLYKFMKRATRSCRPAVRCAREGTCEVDCIDGDAVASARAHVAEAGHIDALADRLGVLGNPARLRLVVALAQQELCVCDCARLVGQSLSAASQHLKELRRIGAVRFRQEGRLAYYRIADDRWLRHVRVLLDEFTRSHVAAAS